MVEANVAVASALDRFEFPSCGASIPTPMPSAPKISAVCQALRHSRVPRHLDRTAIQDLLASVKDTPLSYAVNICIFSAACRKRSIRR